MFRKNQINQAQTLQTIRDLRDKAMYLRSDANGASCSDSYMYITQEADAMEALADALENALQGGHRV